jgi:hypothetical protein
LVLAKNKAKHNFLKKRIDVSGLYMACMEGAAEMTFHTGRVESHVERLSPQYKQQQRPTFMPASVQTVDKNGL